MSKLLLVAGCAVVVASSSAAAALVDLTPGAGSSGTVNDAIFEFFTLQPAGTGVLDPFVRIQANGIEQGYNTSGSPKPFDEKAGPWTRDLKLSEIPIVSVSGSDYFEFVLDINEMTSQSLLSLDVVQIYTSTVGSQTTKMVNLLGDLRYDLDAGEDSHILMDYANAPGSGVTDMRMLVPLANFAGASPDDFVYLYSVFGINASAGNGFEEWGFAREAAVPGVATGALLALGSLAMGRRRRRAA